MKDVVELNFRARPSRKDFPRIWWIGTGLASSMPFHGAGNHLSSSVKNVFNRAISSYTPSVKVLAYSRERWRNNHVQEENVLLAAMPTTSGLDPLAGVEDGTKAVLHRTVSCSPQVQSI